MRRPQHLWNRFISWLWRWLLAVVCLLLAAGGAVAWFFFPPPSEAAGTRWGVLILYVGLVVLYIVGIILAATVQKQWSADILRWPVTILHRFSGYDRLLVPAGFLYILVFGLALMWGIVAWDECSRKAAGQPAPGDGGACNRLLYSPTTLFAAGVAALGVCTFLNTLITRRLRRGEFRGVDRLLDEALYALEDRHEDCAEEAEKRRRGQKADEPIDEQVATDVCVLLYDWTPCPGSLSSPGPVKSLVRWLNDLKVWGARVEAICYSEGMVEEFYQTRLGRQEASERTIKTSGDIIRDFRGVRIWRTTEIGPTHFLVFSGKRMDTTIVYAVKPADGGRGTTHDVEGRAIRDDPGTVSYYRDLFEDYLKDAIRPREIAWRGKRLSFTYCNQPMAAHVCLQIAPNKAPNEDEKPQPPEAARKAGRNWYDVWLPKVGGMYPAPQIRVAARKDQDTHKEKCAYVAIADMKAAAGYESDLEGSKIRLVYCSIQTEPVKVEKYSSPVSLSSGGVTVHEFAGNEQQGG